MPRKLTLEEVKERFLNGGLILDETVYINKNTKMNCHDELGYKYYITLDCVCDKRTSKNAIVSNKNIWSIQNIQNYINLNGGKTKVLSDKYVSEDSPLLMMCECGNLYETNWNRILGIHKFTCTECGIDRRADSHRTDMSLLKQECENAGLNLIEEESVDTHNITVSDSYGYKYKTSIFTIRRNIDSISGSKNNSKFSRTNPFQLENMRHYLKLNNFKVKLSDTVTDNFYVRNEYVDFICGSCGNTFKSTWAQILNGRERCINCIGKQSNIEYKTEEYLKELCVEYEPQKRFNDCFYKRKLPFDFYLPKYNYVIEVNGCQHYYESELFSQSLEERQIIDNIKKDHCIKNNIGYLAIPWWHIDNSELYKTEINDIIGLK